MSATPITPVTPAAPTHSDTATTRLTDPRRLWLARAAFGLFMLLNLGLFVPALSQYAHELRQGCLCDSLARINQRDGAMVLSPTPSGLTAGLYDGDILLAVDGTPLLPATTADQALALIGTGDAGTPIILTVRSGDAPARNITLTRFARYGSIQGGLQAGLSLNTAVAYRLTLEIVLMIGSASIALLIAVRRSDDWMALYAAWTLTGLVLYVSPAFVVFIETESSFLLSLSGAVIAGMVFNFAILFPDGRYTPRWTLIFPVVFGVWELLLKFGVLPLNLVAEQSIFLLLVVLFVFILFYRYRRVFTPLRRQQTKWVVLGIAVAALLVQGYLVLSSVVQATGQLEKAVSLSFYVGVPLSYLPFLLIPISFTFAIFRYRLYDIDLVMNRSLVYGAVTLILLFVVFVGASLLQIVIGNTQSVVAFAISGIGAVALFNPTRKRVQHFVDRRIYRLNFDLNQLNAAQKLPDIKHPGALSGRKLDTYDVLDVIGKGGMGEVYKGQADGQTVALKILPDDLARQDEFRQRFEREAQTLTVLNHPHIVKLYGSGTSDGISYLAMEFINGTELGDRLKQVGKLNLDEVRDILQGIAAALDYAHEQGFVHRDIKPSNVMLRRSRDAETTDAVLMDFGIAKIKDARTRFTNSGAIGTIDYMAPEQIMAAKEVDRRADVYALGVMVYEMLTGERPFKGGAAQVMFAHLQQPAPDPRDLNDAIPRTVAKAVQQALAKKPDDRFATAGEFVLALG